MSYSSKLALIGLALGVVVSFHEVYWPWTPLFLALSAILGVLGARIDHRLSRE
jgi:hypothetical protein